MKKMLVISCMAIFAMACNNNDAKTANTADSTGTAKMEATKAPLPEMPFKLDRPYQNWQPGNPQNAVVAMTGLKAFIDGNMDACVASFGDTVELRFDNYFAKLSNDSLRKDFTKQRSAFNSIEIKMNDWESVISEDKKEEWVTMWYKQINTYKNGKVDSMGVVDDCKIVNGKVVVLDEKIQHLPAKK
jgi:hypothetical protein